MRRLRSTQTTFASPCVARRPSATLSSRCHSCSGCVSHAFHMRGLIADWFGANFRIFNIGVDRVATVHIKDDVFNSAQQLSKKVLAGKAVSDLPQVAETCTCQPHVGQKPCVSSCPGYCLFSPPASPSLGASSEVAVRVGGPPSLEATVAAPSCGPQSARRLRRFRAHPGTRTGRQLRAHRRRTCIRSCQRAHGSALLEEPARPDDQQPESPQVCGEAQGAGEHSNALSGPAHACLSGSAGRAGTEKCGSVTEHQRVSCHMCEFGPVTEHQHDVSCHMC